MHNENAPESMRLATELSKTYQQLLRPFEEVWIKSLMKQQQVLLSAQKATTGTAGPGTFIPPSTSDLSNVVGLNAASLAALKNQTMFPSSPNTTSMTPQQLASLGFGSNNGSSNGNGVGADGMSLTLPQRGGSGSNATSLKANTVDPTMEQISEARAYVARLRTEFDVNRCMSSCIHRLLTACTDYNFNHS